MDKHKDLPEILQKVSDFFEGDLWERMGDQAWAPEREVFLVQNLPHMYPDLANGANELLKESIKIIDSWGSELASSDSEIPNLVPFKILTNEDQELINEFLKMSDYLLALEGQSILNFDLEPGFSGAEDADDYGFSNNDWAIGALLRDYSDYRDDEVENMSFLTYEQADLLEYVELIRWKAVNPSSEKLQEIREFLPRLREIYELNNFANGGLETDTEDFFERFVDSKWIFIRGVVARRKGIDPRFLYKSKEDKEPYVRRELALNPSIPLDLLVALMDDENEDVRASTHAPLASNPTTPVEVLEKIATCSDGAVRRMIIEHPSSTPEIKALAALSN
jgi:hypothetical protein